MATQNNTLKDFLAFWKIILIFSITVSEEMDPRAPECEKQGPRKVLHNLFSSSFLFTEPCFHMKTEGFEYIKHENFSISNCITNRTLH